MSAKPELFVVESADDIATAACARVLESERKAIAESGSFSIALAGGSTPRKLYELLAQSTEATFPRWEVFFGDERWVPASDPASNARMARETLLDRARIPPHQIHPVDTGAGTPEKAAMLYSISVTRYVRPAPGDLPRVDLALLGLGADGHTASLFPGSSALSAGPRDIAVATFAPSQKAWRVTLTAGVLSAARAVLFLVSGADKAEAMSRLLDGDPSGNPPPASLVRPRADASLAIIADRPATSRLRNSP